MNILIINDCGIVGSGAEIRIRLLIEALVKRKTFSEIHVLEHETSFSHLKSIIVHRCSTKNSASVTDRIIKKNNIAIVQVHNLARISTRPIVAAKKLKKPVIFFLHDYWPFCGRRYLFSKWHSACSETNILKCIRCIGLPSYFHVLKTKRDLNQCDLGIAPSRFCSELYERHNLLKSKWRVVTPWIDELFHSPLSANRKREKYTILFVGPLSEAKGAHLLAEAFIKVKKTFQKAKLYYVGSGQEEKNQDRTHIENAIKNAGILSSVYFLGEKTPEQLKDAYVNAGVYVCCPLWPEVFGQTWAQALACGAPVVATRVGSIPELSPSLLVDPTPKDLARGIIRIFEQQQKEESYHWPDILAVVESIEKIYSECLKIVFDMLRRPLECLFSSESDCSSKRT